MGILDQVSEMRNQGMSEAEMSARLQEQGFTPKSINDAFHQEQIRNAVSAEENSMQNQTYGANQNPSFYKPSTQEQQYPQQVPGLPGDMQPPAQAQQYQEQYPQEQYPQQYQEQYQQEQYPQQYQGEYYQDPYQQQSQGYSGGQGSTDTMIEIAEQIFSEKIKKIERQVEQMTEFAALAQTKITNNNERIKRMESIIDKLQIAILEKIGDYGKNLNSIKKEMEMIENSFTKVIPELKKKSHHKK
jgi:hypothetical protein